MGSSPEQYSKFMFALMAGKLISDSSLDSITRSRGVAAHYWGITLLDFADYAQGMWTNEVKEIAHSLGFYGFFPWIDRSDEDPANHFYGIIAVNYRVYFPWSMDLLLMSLTPFLVIFILLSGTCCVLFRLQESHYKSQLCYRGRLDTLTFTAVAQNKKQIGVRK